jgi:hypothetical protein
MHGIASDDFATLVRARRDEKNRKPFYDLLQATQAFHRSLCNDDVKLRQPFPGISATVRDRRYNFDYS